MSKVPSGTLTPGGSRSQREARRIQGLAAEISDSESERSLTHRSQDHKATRGKRAAAGTSANPIRILRVKK